MVNGTLRGSLGSRKACVCLPSPGTPHCCVNAGLCLLVGWHVVQVRTRPLTLMNQVSSEPPKPDIKKITYRNSSIFSVSSMVLSFQFLQCLITLNTLKMWRCLEF